MNSINRLKSKKSTSLITVCLLAISVALCPWLFTQAHTKHQYIIFNPWMYLLSFLILLAGLYRFFSTPKTPQKEPKYQTSKPSKINGDSVAELSIHNHKTSSHANIQQTLALLNSIQALLKYHGFAVSTDKKASLPQIAQEYTDKIPSDAEAISLLMADKQAIIWTEVDDLNSCHAQILLTLIRATGQELGVTDIKSMKNEVTHQCVVTFKSNNRQKRWQFVEPSTQVAHNFLNHAITSIGLIAAGQFILNFKNDALLCYIFIPNQLLPAMSAVFDIQEPIE